MESNKGTKTHSQKQNKNPIVQDNVYYEKDMSEVPERRERMLLALKTGRPLGAGSTHVGS